MNHLDKKGQAEIEANDGINIPEMIVDKMATDLTDITPDVIAGIFWREIIEYADGEKGNQDPDVAFVIETCEGMDG